MAHEGASQATAILRSRLESELYLSDEILFDGMRGDERFIAQINLKSICMFRRKTDSRGKLKSAAVFSSLDREVGHAIGAALESGVDLSLIAREDLSPAKIEHWAPYSVHPFESLGEILAVTVDRAQTEPGVD